MNCIAPPKTLKEMVNRNLLERAAENEYTTHASQYPAPVFIIVQAACSESHLLKT